MEAMPIQQGKTDFTPANYDIEFRNVNLSYETDKQVMQNVSFTAKQGEITALVGPSGGGKVHQLNWQLVFGILTQAKYYLEATTLVK